MLFIYTSERKIQSMQKDIESNNSRLDAILAKVQETKQKIIREKQLETDISIKTIKKEYLKKKITEN